MPSGVQPARASSQDVSSSTGKVPSGQPAEADADADADAAANINGFHYGEAAAELGDGGTADTEMSIVAPELEVDDGEEDEAQTRSIYAASRYPRIPARYQVEYPFDSTTM